MLKPLKTSNFEPRSEHKIIYEYPKPNPKPIPHHQQPPIFPKRREAKVGSCKQKKDKGRSEGFVWVVAIRDRFNIIHGPQCIPLIIDFQLSSKV